MTDDELRAYAEKCRKVAAEYGSMSPEWDTISDINAILAGRPSILNREQIERLIEHHRLKYRMDGSQNWQS